MKKIILFFLLFSQYTFASFDMNFNMQSSYKHIINLEFDEARKLLALEELNDPKNGFIQLQYNYIDFLTILICEEYDFFQVALENKERRIHFLESNDEFSPYYLYSQAEVHLQWAFARLKFQQYTLATYEFVKAYNLLEKNSKLFPSFTLNKKGLGLIHSLLGSVPEKFHWIFNLTGIKAGVEIGLSELDCVLNEKKFSIYENEVLFLLSFLHINLSDNDTVAKKYLNRIGDKYKDNHLLNFAAARLSHHLGKNDYCLNVLENRPSSDNKLPFHYLDYLQGMSYLYCLEYDKSKFFLNRFLNNFKGINYIKSTYHKLACIAYLQYDYPNKDIYFEKVISEGNTLIDEDKVALRNAKNNYITLHCLLKSRLLYDGGYYEKAKLEINRIQILKKNFKFYDEYWYRLARIKAKLKYNINEVIDNYQRSYDFYKKSTRYYAPMSALQIGLIYEKKNERDKAFYYFKKCLSISGFDYERGIHQKAKSGLERIAN